MKAIMVNEFGLEAPMSIEDVSTPTPGDSEVLVKIEAIGVNPLEIAIRTGDHPRAAQVKFPYICGSDLSGIVESIGKNVEDFKPGDRVWGRCQGAYAEYAVLSSPLLGKLPDDYTFSEGASLAIPLLTAWNALVLKGEAKPGDIVLVQGGAGGVGHLAIQLACMLGCRVFATVSSKEKSDFCLQLGADATINYRLENVVERVSELTKGQGVDIVVETAACDNLKDDLELYGLNGRIVMVGTGTGKDFPVEISIRAASKKDVRIYGVSSGNLTPYLPEAMARISSVLLSGKIRPHIGKEMKLEESNDSHELVLSGKFLGKIVLLP